MRAITKRREPASLTAYRKTPDSDYGGYPAKDELRRSLVTEQRGLCCYCMSRIRPERDPCGQYLMKIEHWRSQSRYRSKQLDYRNLLGACLGGHGSRVHLQHCDTRKGDKDLKWNPADPAHHVETRIRYEPDGSIRSDDEEFDAQLNDVMNLNLPLLKNNRKRLLDAVLDWFRLRRDRIRGPVLHDDLIRKRDQHVGGDGELAPYCQVVVWWLDQRLARMAA